MSIQLPDFDTLVKMARDDPEQLERLRQQLSAQLIDEAPDALKHRLRGLQFRVDLECERAGSPMGACLAVSRLMHESLADLHQAITEPATAHLAHRTATILPFPQQQCGESEAH